MPYRGMTTRAPPTMNRTISNVTKDGINKAPIKLDNLSNECSIVGLFLRVIYCDQDKSRGQLSYRSTCPKGILGLCEPPFSEELPFSSICNHPHQPYHRARGMLTARETGFY